MYSLQNRKKNYRGNKKYSTHIRLQEANKNGNLLLANTNTKIEVQKYLF